MIFILTTCTYFTSRPVGQLTINLHTTSDIYSGVEYHYTCPASSPRTSGLNPAVTDDQMTTRLARIVRTKTLKVQVDKVIHNGLGAALGHVIEMFIDPTGRLDSKPTVISVHIVCIVTQTQNVPPSH